MSRHGSLYKRKRRKKSIILIIVLIAALALLGLCWFLFIYKGSPLKSDGTVSSSASSPSPTVFATQIQPTPTPTATPTLAPTPSPSPLPTLSITPLPSPTNYEPTAAERSALTQYNVSLNINVDALTIDGKMNLRYVNKSRDPLYAVQLNLFANGASPDSLSINSVGIDGVRTYYTLSGINQDILTIPLKVEIMPYQSATVFIDFSVAIPKRDSRFGACESGIMLGNIIPTVSMYENGEWRADSYVDNADPFYSEAADYTVCVSLRSDYLLAATGNITKESTENRTTSYYIAADSVRDFALAVFDGNITRTRTKVIDGITVTGYGSTTTAAQFAVDTAAGALSYYSQLIGKYPYKTLHVVPFDASGGMEYPQLIMIDAAYLRSSNRPYGKVVIAHETAHQWFYGIIGSDQITAPWLDESIVEYLALRYIEYLDDDDTQTILSWRAFGEAYSGHNLLTDSIYDFDLESKNSDYYYVVYCYGAQMYKELCTLIGEEKFSDALSGIYNEYYMGIINRGTLIAEFSDAAGYDLSTWFDKHLTRSFEKESISGGAA